MALPVNATPANKGTWGAGCEPAPRRGSTPPPPAAQDGARNLLHRKGPGLAVCRRRHGRPPAAIRSCTAAHAQADSVRREHCEDASRRPKPHGAHGSHGTAASIARRGGGRPHASQTGRTRDGAGPAAQKRPRLEPLPNRGRSTRGLTCRTHSHVGQAGLDARGHNQLPACGNGIHDRNHDQSVRGMAQAPAEREDCADADGKIPPADDHGHEHVQGTRTSSAEVIASTPEAATLCKELPAQQILTEDGKAWNQLQWSQQKGRLLPSKAPPLEIHKAQGDPTPGAGSRALASIPCPEGAAQVSGIRRDGGHSVEDGGRSPPAGVAPAASSDAGDIAQWSHATHTDAGSTSRAEAQHPGPEDFPGSGLDGVSMREELLTWAFCNSSVWCYMNSSVWGLLWNLTFLHRPSVAWGDLRGIARAMQARGTKMISLSRCPSLRDAPKD